MGGPPMPREIGRVRSVNPARREVRVAPRHGYDRALAGRGEVEFVIEGGKRVTYAVETVEEQDRYVKVTLAAGTATDDVASLKGARVLADAAPEIPDNPFEIAAEEFEGFTVRGPDGSEVGVVAGGFNTRAHGVLEIKRPDGRPLLAPFVSEVVAGIDLDRRAIVLRDVEAHLAEQDGDGTLA